MIKNKNKIIALCNDFLSQNHSRWNFGNNILYDMCEKNPRHNNADVIIGKIWLIGRSYAAAIERRRNVTSSNDDFYYDVVAPQMIKIGILLDKRIQKLTSAKTNYVNELLATHKYLTDVFSNITGLEKRSLASKYLHFHVPSKVFIYDERAKRAVQKIVHRPNKSILKEMPSAEYDAEYGDFICRIFELKEFLDSSLGICLTPRKIDSFLLSNTLRKSIL